MPGRALSDAGLAAISLGYTSASRAMRSSGTRPRDGASTTCHSLAREPIDACVRPSRQIRLERQVAYKRSVVLECDFGELALPQVSGSATRLLLPFRLSKGMETLKGGARTRRP
jgi:hypothetical protein